MQLYKLQDIKAKDYYLSFENLEHLVKSGEVKEDKCREFQSELSKYMAVHSGSDVSKVLTTKERLRLNTLMLTALNMAFNTPVWDTETKRLLASVGVRDRDSLERVYKQYKGREKELVNKLEENNYTPNIQDFYNTLEYLESKKSISINEDISFMRYVNLIKLYKDVK